MLDGFLLRLSDGILQIFIEKTHEKIPHPHESPQENCVTRRIAFKMMLLPLLAGLTYHVVESAVRKSLKCRYKERKKSSE